MFGLRNKFDTVLTQSTDVRGQKCTVTFQISKPGCKVKVDGKKVKRQIVVCHVSLKNIKTKGIAICHPEDNFNCVKGMELSLKKAVYSLLSKEQRYVACSLRLQMATATFTFLNNLVEDYFKQLNLVVPCE